MRRLCAPVCCALAHRPLRLRTCVRMRACEFVWVYHTLDVVRRSVRNSGVTKLPESIGNCRNLRILCAACVQSSVELITTYTPGVYVVICYSHSCSDARTCTLTCTDTHKCTRTHARARARTKQCLCVCVFPCSDAAPKHRHKRTRAIVFLSVHFEHASAQVR